MPESSSTAPNERRARAGVHPLARYLGIRAGLTVLLLFGVTLVTFTLTNLVPADPVQAALGEQAAADPEIVQKFREDAGLDQPLPVQYLTYLGNLLHGDLGMSQQTHAPVADDLGTAFPATAELAIAAILISIVLGVGLGMWAALRRHKVTDQVIRVVSLIGISVPSFWLALVVYFVFFSQLHWFPGSGRLSPAAVPPPQVTGMYTVDSLLAGQWATFADAVSHLILPAAVLALYTIGLLTRFARSAILEVLDLDYVRAARAKGLPGHIVVNRYVLRGALVPIITVLGVAFGSLLSGTVLVEKVYSWHGLGEYAYSAATKLDLPAIMGVGLVVGFVYIGLNFIIDVLYGVIDPRVRVA
ncbi:peptide ABC transporter permease [Agromyces sp. Root81]|uniref:ABC transporter permease n=1 Tax=Agromyces sp. Root81 TaxID=1736601 RepID=UPI0006F8C3D0|nr:ABC transporter permease [Agromyces sp. Root81]KRC62549.1 peptide ABC transporter permease [Agromyces sp. Root81]